MKKTSKIISWLCVFAIVAGLTPIFLTNSKATAYEHGDTIEFGSYPQTHITDEALISELDTAGNDIPWSSYGYNVTGGTDFAFYKDVVLDNVKYRAVQFSMYRNAYGYGTSSDNGLQSARGYVINTVHWFRFDPITWTVLNPDEGLLIANVILDSQAINDKYCKKPSTNYYFTDLSYQYYTNDYAHSTVRTWLQNVFTETAFTAQEQSVLTPKELSDATAEMPENCAAFAYPSTEDAVFLLSYAEALNTEYFANKSFRSRKGTDYARAQGLNNYNASNPYDYWFLRSPGNESGHQTHVNLQGSCLMDSADSYGNDIGICPAIYISLDAFDQLGATGEHPTEPSSEPNSEPSSEPDTTEPVTEPNDPSADSYANLSFDFENGILTVSGTGAIPSVENAADAPFATYAEDCKVILISDGITAIQSNAFSGLDQIEMLILNGPVTLSGDAFARNGALQTVICADAVQVETDAFAPDAVISFYEPQTKPHTGVLPNNVNAIPYAFADHMLSFDGRVEMDTYDLLDLMAVMCSYYDDIRFVRFTSYTSLDVPFYVYDKEKGDYVTATDNTLEGVRFSVKIPSETAWDDITFNEFCALAETNELGTFHLVTETESGEEVKDSAFKIIVDTISTGIKKVLKWIVGLMNYFFKVLSKFK